MERDIRIPELIGQTIKSIERCAEKDVAYYEREEDCVGQWLRIEFESGLSVIVQSSYGHQVLYITTDQAAT